MGAARFRFTIGPNFMEMGIADSRAPVLNRRPATRAACLGGVRRLTAGR